MHGTINPLPHVLESRDGVICLAAMIWAGRSGVRVSAGVTVFQNVQTASYPKHTGASVFGGKAQGLEADPSSPFSAEVKNGWNFTEYFPHMHPWRA